MKHAALKKTAAVGAAGAAVTHPFHTHTALTVAAVTHPFHTHTVLTVAAVTAAAAVALTHPLLTRTAAAVTHPFHKHTALTVAHSSVTKQVQAWRCGWW